MMIPRKLTRRSMLRGAMSGAAIGVGLPFLDCFLNTNGTALADGTALPVCFGSWFQGLGFNPGRWEPKIVGPHYDMAPELEPLTPFKDKINIYSGLKGFVDGHPGQVHATGPQICLGGGLSGTAEQFPTIDSLVADAIGTRTRFRSLEVSCEGSSQSFSRRGGSVVNPSETSPVALYTRIFGADFTDPNAAEFKPDPNVIARKSVLSAVSEQRQALEKQLGASDKARLDEYFTSLRSLEQQLELQLQKPAPLAACTIPSKDREATPGQLIDDALVNHRLFAGLLAHALACGQTRVINVMLSTSASPLRRAGSAMTFHIYTHEEAVDPALGYQPNVSWFMVQCAGAFRDMIAALDAIKEGDGTLLDRSLLMYSTDTGLAKFHSVQNIPMLTAGRAGGRIKAGIHVQAKADSVTRVGLTVQQALGVPVSSWGTESNKTSKPFTEVMA